MPHSSLRSGADASHSRCHPGPVRSAPRPASPPVRAASASRMANSGETVTTASAYGANSRSCAQCAGSQRGLSARALRPGRNSCASQTNFTGRPAARARTTRSSTHTEHVEVVCVDQVRGELVDHASEGQFVVPQSRFEPTPRPISLHGPPEQRVGPIPRSSQLPARRVRSVQLSGPKRPPTAVRPRSQETTPHGDPPQQEPRRPGVSSRPRWRSRPGGPADPPSRP